MFGVTNSYGFDMLILSSVYAFFVFFVYHSKEKVYSLELKIFGYLIDVNFISSIFEIACGITIVHLGMNNLITILVNNTYLLILGFFNVILLFYFISISLSEEEIKKRFKTISIIIIILYIVYSISVIALPLELVNDSRGVFSTGPSVMCLVVAEIITLVGCILFMAYGLAKNKVPFKKYIPFIFLYISVILAYVEMEIDHHYTLLSIIETFFLLTMYFTVKNPDANTIRELTIAKSEAEKASNAKSDFLSSMSHEVRTPLNQIMGFTEDIKQNKDDIPESVYEDADFILDASNKLLEIFSNILDVNAMETSNVEIKEEKYHFIEEIESVINKNKTIIGDKPINIISKQSEDIPDMLYGDINHIKVIVNNIISNSIKYTDEGTIRVDTSCEIKGSTCNLKIEISDTGKGMTKEELDNLFTKFNRSEDSKNSTISGTGLGLVIVKNLVELLKGKIDITSTIDTGTRVIINIPQKLVQEKSSERP